MEIIVNLVEFKSKKIVCRRGITIFDIIGEKLGFLTNLHSERVQNEFRHLQDFYLQMKDVSYLPEHQTIIAKIGVGLVEAFFFIRNIFGHQKFEMDLIEQNLSEAAIIDKFYQKESKKLFYFLFKTVKKLNPIIIAIDPSSLSHKVISSGEMSRELIPFHNIKREYSNLSGSRVLMTTPKSSLILDLKDSEVVARARHRLEINAKNRQFYYLDDIIAWSSASCFTIAKVEKRDEEGYRREIALVREVNLNQYLQASDFYQSVSHEFNLFKLEDGNYMISFFSNKSMRSGEKELIFVRIIFNPKDLEIKEVKSYPGDGSLNPFDPNFPVYKIDEFMVFCFDVKLDQLQKTEPNSKIFSKFVKSMNMRLLHLASFEAEIFDRSQEPLLIDYKQRCPMFA